jgi:hypothetical protein
VLFCTALGGEWRAAREAVAETLDVGEQWIRRRAAAILAERHRQEPPPVAPPRQPAVPRPMVGVPARGGHPHWTVNPFTRRRFA